MVRLLHYTTTIILASLPIGMYAAPSQEVLTQMQQYFQKAQEAIQHERPYLAQEAYVKLLELAEAHGLEENAYLDLCVRVAQLHHALHEYREEQAVLEKLLNRPSLNNDMLLLVAIQQARLYKELEKNKDAFAILQALEQKIPLDAWKEQDRQLYVEIKENQNDYYHRLLLKAESFIEAGLYLEATPLYLEVLTAGRQGLFPEVYFAAPASGEILPQVRLRLAQCYFLADEYPQAIRLLEEPEPCVSPYSPGVSKKRVELEQNEIYLLSLAYRHAGYYESAIVTLRRYLGLADQPHLEHYVDAQWELGLCYFHLGKYIQARSYFEWIEQCFIEGRRSLLAQVYLARLSIMEQEYGKAEERLCCLEKKLDENDTLRFQIDFLRGEIAFRGKSYAQAADHFEKALPPRNQKRAEWTREALYHLGWSYLRIADDPLKGQSAQEKYFSKAQDAFKRLIDMTKPWQLIREKTYLSLGQAYLRRGFRLNEEAAYAEAEKILSQEEYFKSKEALAQSLLLRAEASASYDKSNALYIKLTEDFFQYSPVFPQAWYLKGVNDYKEGLKQQALGNNKAAEVHFSQAIASLAKAYELLKHEDAGRAAMALKYQAEVYYALETKESQLMAFSILQDFIQQRPDLLAALPDGGEIYYLRGLVASKLAQGEEEQKYNDIAEQSMGQVISHYCSGKFCEPALYFLGAFRYKQGQYAEAQQWFLKLAIDYPNSQQAGEALFWAAECMEALQQDPALVQRYRKQVYEQYPNSLLADEAYFTAYSYADYLQGNPLAIEHLQAMLTRFPKSPCLVAANYLLGLDFKRDRKSAEGNILRKKDLVASVDAFEQAKKTYESCAEISSLPLDKRTYYATLYYHAQQEKAFALLAFADESSGTKKQVYFDYAEAAFNAIKLDLQNPQHPLAMLLCSSGSFNPILEESLFGLGQVYLKVKKEDEAEKVFNEMIEAYNVYSIKIGYFLSRTWYELGCIMMNRKDYQLALQCFEHAGETGKGTLLTSEQKLDLWIQQSMCYRFLDQLDTAMVLLSKVVNDDTVSSLRLKAMYLRAEIYEIQGRHELAVKQLEAMSKKGGEWAAKATEQLEKEYGYY